MKLEKINNWFRKLAEAQVKHRVIFLVALGIFTIVSLAGLANFETNNGDEGWFLETDIAKVNAEKFKEHFGNDDSVGVLVTADDVFNPRVLEMIGELGNALLDNVPFADKINSLMKVEVAVGDEEGITITNPFQNGVPSDAAELEEKKQFILSRDTLRNSLVSDDAKETWVVLDLLPFEDKENDVYLVGAAVEKILNQFKSDEWDLNATGTSYITYIEDKETEPLTFVSSIAGLFVTIICLIVMTRSIFGLLIPLAATILGEGVVFGWCGYLGIKPDSLIITLPIMLGMALSIGYSIHYINAFKLAYRKTGKRSEAVILSVSESGWPTLFTVITTVASLGSFLFVPVPALSIIGLVCAAMVFTVYLYVAILVPCCQSFGKEITEDEKQKAKQEKKNAREAKTDARFAKFGEGILRKTKLIVAASVVVVLVSVFGCFKMKVDMTYTEMYGTKLDFVARIVDIMNSKIGNLFSYNIIIDFDEEDIFKEPEQMKKLDLLSEELAKLPLTKISNGKARVSSVTQIVKEMNCALNEDDKDFYCIPDDQDLLTQELFLYEISGGNYLKDWLTEDYSKTYVTVEMANFKTSQIESDIDAALEAAKKFFPDAEVGVEGYAIEQASMNTKIVSGEIQSILISFVIIAILMMIAFSGVRTGLIGMIPNVVPVLVIGGVMGIAHFSMDMMTMMIMPMVLGIAVDDTIHFTNHTKFFFEKCGDYKESIVNSFSEIGKSMFFTTAILVLMFVVYMFSPMKMFNRVGLMSIIGLATALAADYTITPVLIYLTKPFGKSPAAN